MSDRLARVALSVATEPGDPRVARLVEAHGAAALYAGLRRELDTDALAGDAAARVRTLDAERLLDGAHRLGIRFVTPEDPEWPPGLADLLDVEPLNGHVGPPLGLWVRGPGDLASATARSVAVVGSRSATTYGAAVAGGLAAHVADAGWTVVSGAAFGIDQAAHRGALGGAGGTVAVLACGVDRAYPAAHRELLDHVARTGLVVSELPPGCAPTRVRFLSRNRLIAALTGGTVVVEAAVRSGALNTASWALRLHRVVMGVPGPVTSAPSEGVHELIRSRGAALVTRGAEVLELVAPAGSHLATPARAAPGPRDHLPERERRVLDAVPVHTAAPTPNIARAAGLAEESVLDCLERLQPLGLVELRGGGWRLGGAAAGR